MGTDASVIVGGVSNSILAFEMKGRYYASAHNYAAAEKAFNQAEGIYASLFNTRPRTWPSTGFNLNKGLSYWGGERNYSNPAHPTCGLKNDSVLITGGSGIPHLYLGWAQLKLSKINTENIFSPVEKGKVIQIFGHGDNSWKQFFAITNKPYLILKPNAMGLLNRSRINRAKKQKLKKLIEAARGIKPDQTITKAAILDLLEVNFRPAEAKYRAAKGAEGAYYRYLNAEYATNSRKGEILGFFRTRLNRRFELARGRIKLGKAMLLLQTATRMKVNNPESARVCLDEAIKILKGLLNGNLHTDPPELLLNGLSTLAWAYSSKANLLEEEERGTGRNEAVKAAVIYRYLLHGKSSLSKTYKLRNSTTKITGGAVLKSFWNKAYESKWSDILLHAVGKSFQDALDGKRVSGVHGFRSPDMKYGTVALDLLGMSGTNELDIYLSLGDCLTTLRQYDDALKVYDGVLRLEGTNNPNDWIKNNPLLFMRAKNGRGRIVISQVEDTHSRNKEYNIGFNKLINPQGTITLCEGVLTKLAQVISGGDQFTKFKRRIEMLKASTTLAWAYGTGARFSTELGHAPRGLKYAIRAEAIYRALRGEPDVESRYLSERTAAASRMRQPLTVTNKRSDQEFVKWLKMIRVNYHNVGAWGKRKPKQVKDDLKAEVNISDGQLDLGVGDALALQRKYQSAISEYSKMITTFANPGPLQGSGRRYYFRALLGRDSARIFSVRQNYNQNGYLQGTEVLLLRARDSLYNKYAQVTVQGVKTRMRTSEMLRVRLLKATLHGVQSWASLQQLDRSKADKHSQEAIKLTSGVIADIKSGEIQVNGEAKKRKITEETQLAAYTNLGQLYFQTGELYKAWGEKDNHVVINPHTKKKSTCLERAEDMYALAKSEYKKIGLGTETLGKLGLDLASFELDAFRARYYKGVGLYSKALQQLNSGKIDVLKGKIVKALEEEAPALAFKGLQTLKWMLGTIGGIKEKTVGDGGGKREFLEAALIDEAILGIKTDPKYVKMLGQAEVDRITKSPLLVALRKKSKILSNDTFLWWTADKTKTTLQASHAEVLKAAGKLDWRALTLAEQSFDKAIQEFKKYRAHVALDPIKNRHPLHYLLKIGQQQAYVGKAENYIFFGKYREEYDQFRTTAKHKGADESYAKAIGLLFKTEVLGTLDQNDRSLAHVVAATKFVKTATWALGTLAELRDNLDNKNGLDTTTNERKGFLRALLLSRLLTYGNHLQGEWKEISKEAQTKSKKETLLDEDRIIAGLKVLVPFLQDQRTTLLNDEVHFALDQLPVETRAGYVYNLITARRYNIAAAEADRVFNSLNGSRKTNRTHETLANLFYTVGTIHSYNYPKETDKGTSFKKARKLYLRAEESLGIMLSNMPNAPKDTSFARLSNYFATNRVSAHNEGLFAGIQGGLAFIDMEYGDIRGARYDRAIRRYGSVIGMHRFKKYVQKLEKGTALPETERHRGLNRKRIRMLAEGYIGKANAMAYSEQNKYKNEAHRAYKIVRKWLEGKLKDNSIFKRIIVRSYQGEADAYTLLTTSTNANDNYKKAIVATEKGLALYYEKGTKKIKEPTKLPVNDRKEIAKLYISKGAAEAKLCRIKVSHQSYNTSNGIIDTIRKNGHHYRFDASRREIEEGIIEGHRSTNQEQTTCPGSKSGEVNYRTEAKSYTNSDGERKPSDGHGYRVAGQYHLDRFRSTDVSFDSGPPRVIEDPFIPSAGKRFKNLEIGGTNSIGINYNHRYEGPPYNVGIAVGAKYNHTLYKTYLQHFKADWTGTIRNPDISDEQYMGLGINVALYGEWGKKLGLNRKLTFIIALDGGIHIPLAENPTLKANKVSNDSEMEAAKRISDPELKRKTIGQVKRKRKNIDQIENPIPFSLTASAYGKINFDSSFFKAFSKERYFMLQSPTIFAKLSAGYDTSSPMEENIWSPDGKFAGFVRGSVGASTALVWKKHYSVTGSAEVGIGGLFGVVKGDPINEDENLTISASGNLTFSHILNNNFAWFAKFGGYYYKSQDIEGGALTLGGGMAF